MPPRPRSIPRTARTILFTGHRIDRPGRPEPRFPADREGAARQAIEAAVRAERDAAAGEVMGIAGGASGGDILFHEVCQALSVPTTLFLLFPHDAYVSASVQEAGPGWVERFRRLARALPTRVLQDSAEGSSDTLWDRNNLWMLEHAVAHGGANATLIALWDGGPGDGPGGTQHLVEAARQRGVRVIILGTREIFASRAR
jgi:hypothetical protein